MQESSFYPHVYDVHLNGYKAPITVSGQYSFVLTPVSSTFSDDYYTPGYYYEYTLEDRGYAYYTTTEGNTSTGYSIVSNGSGFLWTYTHDGLWDPSFSIGALVPSYTRVKHSNDPNTPVDEEPVTTQCEMFGVPAGFVVNFHID